MQGFVFLISIVGLLALFAAPYVLLRFLQSKKGSIISAFLFILVVLNTTISAMFVLANYIDFCGTPTESSLFMAMSFFILQPASVFWLYAETEKLKTQ